MKNDKVINEVADIINNHLDKINEDYTSIAVTSCAAEITEFLNKPTTDIDEVRRRLTWAMGVQGSPVAMLGDYEIDWIMNFFLPYLKGGE